jgi:dipeptidyl aminopeptidase/acylaminoacyl peptidase
VRQLTSHAKKSSTSPAWSPDGTRLAFTTDRDDKRQIYVIDPRGGEARKLTSVEEGVGSFEWSPDGKSIAFTATEARTDADKEREKQFGEFDVIGEGYRMSHLWHVRRRVQKARRYQRRLYRRSGITGRPTAPRSPSTTASTRPTPAAPRPTSRSSRLPTEDPRPRETGRARPVRSGRRTGRRSRSGRRDVEVSSPFLNNAVAVISPRRARREHHHAFDENPVDRGWTEAGLSSAPRSTPGRSSTASIRRRRP